MDKNREFAELVGLCWHEKPDRATARLGLQPVCEKCGRVITFAYEHNPDFTDPRLVLREMDKQPAKIRHLFYAKLIYNGNNVEAIDDDGLISRHYMTDQTGKLRDKAIEWMKGKNEGSN